MPKAVNITCIFKRGEGLPWHINNPKNPPEFLSWVGLCGAAADKRSGATDVGDLASLAAVSNMNTCPICLERFTEKQSMSLQPKKLTEIDRAEIMHALQGQGALWDALRAHFLYEDIASNDQREKIVHPRHYNMGGAIGEDGSAEYEVIKIIEDLGWGYPFCMGNALKYVLRAPHKGAEAEDLKKAQWYLERAERHRGGVVARVFRKMTEAAVCQAWGLPGVEAPQKTAHRLGMVVYAIMDGDPVSALNNYKLYLIAKDKTQ